MRAFGSALSAMDHSLESYQGHRDSYIRAMNQHGDSKGIRFLLKRISEKSWIRRTVRVAKLKGHGYEICTGVFSEYEFASSKNSNSNRLALGGSIIRDWTANQKTAIKEKSLAKAKSQAKSPHPPLPLSRWRLSPRDIVLFVT